MAADGKGGRCPDCKSWLTFRQIVAMPKGRHFQCPSCKTSLVKTSTRMFIVVAWLAVFFAAKGALGWGSLWTWAVIAGMMLTLLVDGLLFAPVARAKEIDHPDDE